MNVKNLVKCENGHYYDGDKFDSCPHCAGSGIKNDRLEKTVDLDLAVNNYGTTASLSMNHSTVPDDSINGTDDFEKTVGMGTYMGKTTDMQPVVGWLVCIKGESFGSSFTLKAGKNFIGRSSAANDVALKGDKSISREKHAIVIYDPKSRIFLAQPGTSSELFYVNDKVILQATEIRERDIITIGNTNLVFIPFCGAEFSWDTL